MFTGSHRHSQMPAKAKNEQLSRSWYAGPCVAPVKYLFMCENGFQKRSMRMIKESKIMTMIRMDHLENIERIQFEMR